MKLNSSVLETKNVDYDKKIDLSGLNCPLPILKTKAALVTMRAGEVLKIILTNRDSVRELHMFAKQSNSTIDDISEVDGSYTIFFRKG